jgi:eukaryotic-like serine/threonine-protein kinase
MADEPTISPEAANDPERRRRFEAVLGAYFEALDAGQSADRQALLDRHPDLAAELAEFFAEQDRFHRLVAPSRSEATEPGESPAQPPDGPTDSHLGHPTTAATPPKESGASGLVETQAQPSAETLDSPSPVRANGDGIDLPRGTKVRYFGDYEIHEELGRGGMGVVYRARQLSLNRSVALKMIKAGVLADETELRRFQNEAEAVAQLDHPGIVPVYEVGEHEGQKYFCMKLVEGGRLADRLDDYKNEPRAAARLVAEATEAVHHAHLRGILHRDLKPANILIDDQGRPHVTDFGLARKVEGDSELTQSGAILGTPAYMAPEQASGRRRAVTTASDGYGLGAILYALLTGQAPFGGDSVVETLDAVRNLPPKPPSRLRAGVPRDLEIICLKCLKKDPQQRYPSALALAEDLRRHLAGEPITARRVGVAERAWLWCRRNKALAALGALLIASLIAGTGFSLAFAVRANKAAGLANQEATRANVQAEEAGRQRDWSERLRYIAEVNLAQRDWDAGNAELARSRLADVAPATTGAGDVRGWEWFYLQSAFRPELREFRIDDDQTWSVDFAPDGRILASAAESGVLRLWDVASGREIAKLRGHHDRIWSLTFSPDGRTLASAGADGTVRLWDVSSKSEVATLRGHQGWVREVGFSPDGRSLASAGSDYTVRLWDVMLRTETATFQTNQSFTNAVVFSPDGRLIATAGSDGVQLRDVTSGRETATLRGHEGRVESLAFAPDGRILAAAGDDGTVRLWDVSSGRETFTLRQNGRIWTVAFSPDGGVLAATGYDGAVRLWDPRTGRETAVLRGHQLELYSVAFAPDGHILASAGSDGTVRLWDVQSGQAFASAGGTVSDPWSLALSHDGHSLAAINGDGMVRMWDVASGRRIAKPLRHQVRADTYSGTVAFSPAGNTLATASSTGDGTVRLWDVATSRETAVLRGHRGGVNHVAFSPDGRLMASVGTDGTIRLWDVSTSREVARLSGHTGWVMTVAFSPDGRVIASGGDDGTVRLWDVASGNETAVLRGPHQRIMCVVFAPDGKTLASDSRIWDLASGREVSNLRGHQMAVASVAFTPDGRQLASGSWDGTVRLWDLASGREAAALRGHGDGAVWSIVFSPDGHTLVSGGGGLVRTWDAAPLTLERAANREALGLVRFTTQRAGSLTDCRDRIVRCTASPEEVRTTALDLVDDYWKSEMQDRAEKLVSPLFAEGRLRDEAEQVLRNREGLTAAVRERALEAVKVWPESASALNDASWNVARAQGRDVSEYLLALRRAETACRYDPDFGSYVTTIGVVQYRIGRYREAEDTLTRSYALNIDSIPPELGFRKVADLAFLAMAQQRLGQSDAARRSLAQLRTTMKSPGANFDAAESAAFLREGEVLIELDPVFPADPFAP